MSTSIFRIRNLSCSYSLDKKDTVLHINELDIPSGELIFLLGASGFGKSTLLESLALMNNTIAEGSIDFITSDDESISYSDIHGHHDLTRISGVRKKHFSFIFQNTNLMENFTAYENICLPRMIQQDVSQEVVMEGAIGLMNKVGLPQSSVSLDTLSVRLSGGQRQRVAFVRALNSQFNVLFGDEPTGNLDESNANELMTLIRSSIDDQHSAIIVSHDITLALNHASRIICITKTPDKDHGEILPENIFVRKDWQNKSTDELLQFKEKIRTLYNRGIEHDQPLSTTTASVIPPKTKLDKSFLSLFLKKEGKALAGNFSVNLIILTALLFFTFLTLGFANGCLNYLHKKMENAFVNWLPVSIPWSRVDDVARIEDVLNSDSLKAVYGYKSVTTYSEQPLRFYSPAERTFLPIKGRSIEMGATIDPILTDILDPRYLVVGDKGGFRDKKDLSIIVTRRFMTDLGYDINTPFVDLEVPVFDTTKKELIDLTVPIGIRDVVEELPGKFQFAYTSYFMSAYLQNDGCTFDTRNKRKILRIMVDGDSAGSSKVYKAVDSYFSKSQRYVTYRPEARMSANHDSYHTAYNVDISFSPIPESYKTLDSMYNDVANSEELKPYKNKIRQMYDYNDFTENFIGKTHVDEMSINFEKLDNVHDFASLVLKIGNENNEKNSGNIIELDVAKVREKENFNFLSKVTNITSYLLIIFGVISTSLFILNLLKMHLSKVKMNIGTFTAFGLSNNKVQLIYFLIMLRFILLSLMLSVMLAFGAGYLLNLLLPSAIIVEKGGGISYFKLVDTTTLITLIVILCCVTVVSYLTIRNMLYKSPGDLIYNR